MTSKDAFLYAKACMALDKLQVELHPDSPYEIPSIQEIRERLLKVMNYLEEIEINETH